MDAQLKLPSITSATPEGKLLEIQSYLYQLIGQLNWAFSAIEGSDTSDSTTSDSDQDTTAQNTYSSVKGLITQDSDILTEYYEGMKGLMADDFVTQENHDLLKASIAKQIKNVSSLLTQVQEAVFYSAGQIVTLDFYGTGIVVGQTIYFDLPLAKVVRASSVSCTDSAFCVRADGKMMYGSTSSGGKVEPSTVTATINGNGIQCIATFSDTTNAMAQYACAFSGTMTLEFS